LKTFVLDCSITMAWCFADEANDRSDEVLELLKESNAIVPSIWTLEVINVLHVAERKKRITPTQSNTFINLLAALPIEVDMSLNDLPNKQILEISRKYKISAYDAAYLELALRKKVPLFSFDMALCIAAKKARALQTY
jgi:predicted nucleic acid-binding protein